MSTTPAPVSGKKPRRQFCGRELSEFEDIRRTLQEEDGIPHGESYDVALEVIKARRTAEVSRPRERAPMGILGGMTADLLAKEPLPEREVLFGSDQGPLFFKQSINQLLAHRGVGKTMLGLSIAGALATGGSCMGFKASRPLRVTYVDGELPLSQLKERAGLLCSGAEKQILFMNPELNTPASVIRLLDSSSWERFLQLAVTWRKSEVIILDSYSTLFWMDANKEDAQIRTQERLNELRTLGMCVIALQHTGKDKVTQRGHSRNEDGLDTQILLERPESAVAGRVAFDVSYPKVRHQANLEPEGTWTLEGSLWVKGQSPDEISIREYLKEGKGVREICRELNVGDHTVSRARRKMIEEGLLTLNAKVSKVSSSAKNDDNGRRHLFSAKQKT